MRRFALVAILLFGACARPSPRPPSDDERAAAIARLCRQFEADQRANLDAISAFEHADVDTPLGRCFPGKKGAWGLSIDSLSLHAYEYELGEDGRPVGPLQALPPRGRWSIAHISVDGARTAVRLAVPIHEDTYGGEWSPTLRVDPPVVFDWDGDGEEEILVVARFDDPIRGSTYARLLRYDASKNAIERDPRAREVALAGARDVDGDGRPDLFTYDPWRAVSFYRTKCTHFRYEARGPLLVLHARADGTFSRDDDVARRFVRDACAPIRGSLAAIGGADGTAAVLTIACARLNGLDAATLVRAIDAECRPIGVCDGPDSNCDDPDVWRALAAVEPPFRL